VANPQQRGAQGAVIRGMHEASHFAQDERKRVATVFIVATTEVNAKEALQFASSGSCVTSQRLPSQLEVTI
jgi:hypothetical protein